MKMASNATRLRVYMLLVSAMAMALMPGIRAALQRSTSWVTEQAASRTVAAAASNSIRGECKY